METTLIDGKKLAEEYQAKLKMQVAKLKQAPTLAVILVGDDPASQIYVRHKRKVAERVGIISELFHLSPVMTQEALIAFIQELNANDKVDGILVQLPLPKHMDADAVLEAIDPRKDVDGLTSANLGHLFAGRPQLVPCTPMACMALLKTVCPNLQGKNVVVVGRSKLVGKPLSQMLLDENCTVTQAHSKTVNLKHVCRQADIIIVAVGKAGLITKSFVKKGAVIIDVGINRRHNGQIVGDVDFKKMPGHVAAITPVPGGVGPMTVTMLISNTLQAHQQRRNIETTA
ncbi:MAG: bifunctional methylenetetrahydrofolate dehydrogenase/methenyltetrahydrofolate cyclohydrolase FolD [Alphaproteobacteria bacterium]